MTIAKFAIGAEVWPGVSKLLEEAGEVVQVGGKLLGTDGVEEHWDGTNLRTRLEDELADLAAAIEFVRSENHLDRERMAERTAAKLQTFRVWHRDERANLESGRIGRRGKLPSSPERRCKSCKHSVARLDLRQVGQAGSVVYDRVCVGWRDDGTEPLNSSTLPSIGEDGVARCWWHPGPSETVAGASLEEDCQ